MKIHHREHRDHRERREKKGIQLTPSLLIGIFSLLPLCALCVLCGEFLCAEPPKILDPAAWGSDHVGKPVPEFTSGDECLFCHRMDIGPTWSENRHGRTVRAVDAKKEELKDLASEAQFILGVGSRQRFLQKGESAGQLNLLDRDKGRWDAKAFGDGCAGCHCTAVEVKTRSFAALSLDCFVCHGDPSDKHTKDGSQAFLSRKRNDSARVVTSICAQCHVRGGTAKSSGLPYPNNFVAGDNLFRDFGVDLSDEAIKKANPADAHVLANVRDVVLLGREEVTCLTCHEVHKQKNTKHHRIVESELCWHCHNPTGPKKDRPSFTVHSKVCGY